MTENSAISWTDHTFNPWIGCQKVGPLCDNCYAEAWDKRAGGEHWGPGAPRRRTQTWREPLKWNAAAKASGKRAKVFMASLADFFDNAVDPQWRRDAWNLVKYCPHLDWLILTKRPGNIGPMLADDYSPQNYPHITIVASMGLQEEIDRDMPKLVRAQELYFLPRIGISAEPMLGPLDISNWQMLDWVICGGESGPKRRPFDMAWAEDLREQCALFSIPFFFKQDSAMRPGQRGRASDELWATKEWPEFAP